MTYQKSDPQTIQAMFNNIANSYDFTNSVLSFRMHKHWNKQLVRTLLIKTSSHTLIDLCAGTGDIAFDYLKSAPASCKAYLIDFSSNMLQFAKSKSQQLPLQTHQLEFMESDVEKILLPDGIADVATIAYGIRNVKNPNACIKEIYRLLKSDGKIGILELTQPSNFFLHHGHHLYLKYILPWVGKWITTDKEAYKYLCNSIHTFIPPVEIEKLLQINGFIETNQIPLSGGIATIITGRKAK